MWCKNVLLSSRQPDFSVAADTVDVGSRVKRMAENDPPRTQEA